MRIKIIKKPSDKLISQIMDVYSEAGWLKEWDNKKRISDIVNKSYTFFAVFEGKKIVAIARVISDGVNDAYIQDLAVKKDMRGLGIGSKLLSFVKNYLVKKGFKFIILVSQNNTERFYMKNGFKLIKSMKVMLYEVKKNR